jgi:hypothetical protein
MICCSQFLHNASKDNASLKCINLQQVQLCKTWLEILIRQASYVGKNSSMSPNIFLYTFYRFWDYVVWTCRLSHFSRIPARHNVKSWQPQCNFLKYTPYFMRCSMQQTYSIRSYKYNSSTLRTCQSYFAYYKSCKSIDSDWEHCQIDNINCNHCPLALNTEIANNNQACQRHNFEERHRRWLYGTIVFLYS